MARATKTGTLSAAQTSRKHTVDYTAYGYTITVGKRGVAVTFWNDGTMTRADVRLDLATNLTLTAAAKLLGLEAL